MHGPDDTRLSTLVAELGEVLPADMRDEAPRLARALLDVLAGRSEGPRPALAPLLAALAGRRLSVAGTLLSFGAGAQVGDVSIGTLAGGDSITVQLGVTRQTIVAAETAYDVRGLPNPYLGLRPFTYAERERFGGRERQVARALELLLDPGGPAPLVVTGASGSGKSSFVQAGVLPALAAHYEAHGRALAFAVVRPGERPLARLADALARLGLPPDGSGAGGARTLGAPRALVVDQLEELFTQADPDERAGAMALLADLGPRARPVLHLIATLRSDFLPELFPHQALYDVARAGIDLRAMRPEELQAAIERPLAAHPGRMIEPALCRRLAAEAAGDAAYLPLLQVTLEDLWRRGSLSLAAYGSLTDAIRQRAEDVYAFADATGDHALLRPEAERHAILAICTDLVAVSLDDDPRRDVRRRRGLDELAGGDPLRARLIGDLVAARLLSRTLEQRGAAEVVDLVHESLIDGWDRLRDAVAERRALLQRRARFDLALAEWRAAGRPDDLLLDRARLAEAESLAEQDDVALRDQDARAFLAAGIAQREAERARELAQARALAEEQRLRAEESARANRRLRRQLLVVVTLGAVTLLAGGLAFFSFERATREADRATRESARAEENARLASLRDLETQSRLAASGRRESGANPGRAALLAAEMLGATLASGESRVAAVDTARAALAALEGQSITGAWGGVGVAALSPDGHTLATSGFGEIRLWDLRSADPAGGVRTMYAHERKITTLAFSADGRRLLSAGHDSVARLWELDAPERPLLIVPVSTSGGGRITDHRVALAPDGGSVFTADPDGAIMRWPVGGEPQELGRHASPVEALAVSLDGRWLVSGDDEGMVLICDLAARQPVARSYPGERLVKQVAFSPDGRRLAIARQRDLIEDVGMLELWEPGADRTWEPARLLEDPGSGGLLAFSPDGRWLISAGGMLNLFNVDQGADTTTLWNLDAPDASAYVLAGHAGLVSAVAFNPSSRILATGGHDTRVLIWNLAALDPGRANRALGEHDQSQAQDLLFGGVTALHFLSDDELLTASGPHDANLRLYRGTAATGVFEVDTPASPLPNGETLVPGGDMLATTGPYLLLWELGSPTLSTSLRVAGARDISAVAADPDGRWLVAGDRDGRISRWALDQGLPRGEPRRLQAFERAISSLALSPDGALLAVGSLEGGLSVYTTDQLQLQASSEIGTLLVISMAFSPDSRWLLIEYVSPERGSLTGLALWPTGTREGQLLELPEARVSPAYAFSPDGRILAVGTPPGATAAAYLYDLVAADPPATQRSLGGNLSADALAFTPDSQTLAVGGSDRTIYLYRVNGPPNAASHVLRAHEGSIQVLATSPDGRWLVSGGRDGAVWQWDLGAPDPQTTRSLVDRHGREIRRLRLDQDGRRVVVVDEERVRVFPLQPKEIMATLCRAVSRNLSADEWATFMGDVPYRPTCPEHPVHPTVIAGLLTALYYAAEAGTDAPQAIAELRRLTPLGIDPTSRRALCRQSAEAGRTELAAEQCAAAVEQAPADPDARFWRGVARSLAGDRAGAADDLAFWVEHARAIGWNAERLARRATWLDELRAGRDPFAGPDGLARLEGE